MEILVENLGIYSERTKKVLNLKIGNSVDFNFLDEKITVTISEIENEFFTILTNRGFCYDFNGKIDLTDVQNSFKVPFNGVCVIALPLYDASYKLKFSVLEENK